MKRSGGRTAIRGLQAGLLAALAFAGAAAPAGAEITVFQAYNDLTPSLKPAPLVAMSFPAALGPVGGVRVVEAFDKHGHYTLLYSRSIPSHSGGFPTLAASLLVKNIAVRSLTKEARSVRRLYRESPLLVRGRKGVLLKSKHASTVALLWAEGGGLFELATGTPKAISVPELQTTAAALDRLVGQLSGETPAETGFTARGLDLQARVMVGEHSALIEAGWTARCTEPGPSELTPSGVGASIVALPITGGSVSLAASPVRSEDTAPGETASWSLGLSGTVSPSGGQLTEQVSGTADAWPCALGPASFPLSPFHEL